MEQIKTTFSLRKCFEEMRIWTALKDGSVILTTEQQEEICNQVDAQEKKYTDNINLLSDTVQSLKDQVKVYASNPHDMVLIIDTMQRAITALSETGDLIARDKATEKLLWYIEKL